MCRHKYLLALGFVLLIWPLTPLADGIIPGAIYTGVVEQVIDGDTVHCLIQMEPKALGMFARVGVRLAGIDTPELRGKCAREKTLAKQAKEILTSLLPAGTVVILSNIDRDKYSGRLVAIIHTTQGEDVADKLKGSGLAKPYAGRSSKPDWCSEPSVVPEGKKEIS